MTDNRLLLTCGLPGAGKTTLARHLAVDRNAVRLTTDEWLVALGSNPWDESTRDRVEAQLWSLTQELVGLGVSVVLDFGLWTRTERDEMRRVARALGVGVELHYLDLSEDKLWQRVEARNASPPWSNYPISRDDLEGWARLFERPGPDELALFDEPPS